jgi:hypothetical protein
MRQQKTEINWMKLLQVNGEEQAGYYSRIAFVVVGCFSSVVRNLLEVKSRLNNLSGSY